MGRFRFADTAGMLLGPPPATVKMFCAKAGTAKDVAKHQKHNTVILPMILNMICGLRSPDRSKRIGPFPSCLSSFLPEPSLSGFVMELQAEQGLGRVR